MAEWDFFYPNDSIQTQGLGVEFNTSIRKCTFDSILIRYTSTTTQTNYLTKINRLTDSFPGAGLRSPGSFRNCNKHAMFDEFRGGKINPVTERVNQGSTHFFDCDTHSEMIFVTMYFECTCVTYWERNTFRSAMLISWSIGVSINRAKTKRATWKWTFFPR